MKNSNKKKISQKELQRRQRQRDRDNGVSYLLDEDGGAIKATPVKGGYQLGDK